MTTKRNGGLSVVVLLIGSLTYRAEAHDRLVHGSTPGAVSPAFAAARHVQSGPWSSVLW